MKAKYAALIAAVVAVIAVLAAAPAADAADDEAQITYLGVDQGDSFLQVVLPTAQSSISIELTVGEQTFHGSAGNNVNRQTSYLVMFADTTLPEGEYTYTIINGQNQSVASGSFSIGEVVDVPTYKVTIADSENGEVTADQSEGLGQGAPVVLTVVADEGYKLSELTVADADVTADVTEEGTYSFTMPASDVAVSATFESETPAVEYTVTYGADITVTDASGAAVASGSKVAANTVLTVTAAEKQGQTAAVSPALTDGKYTVTADVEFTVTYTPVQYAITWMNGTETLATDQVAYGAVPAYSGAAPVKAADAQYTYAFAGWSATADGEALSAIPAVTGAATYYAVFTATAIPSDVEYTVTYGDDITVVDASGAAVASGSKVKAGTVLTVTAAEKEGQVATIEPALTNGTYTVVADVTFSVTYKEQKSETGVSADGKDYESVQAAVDAVASKATAAAQQTVEISKDITGNVTLADNVVVKVTEDGSYNGTVSYTDAQGVVSTVAVKIAKGSSVTITGGSVKIAGTFVGANEFEVTSGTAVLSGEVEAQSSVVVNVADGATLQIGDLTADYTTSTVKVVGTVAFAPNTVYKGPAIVNDSGVIKDIAYNEGSRIYFVEEGKDIYENIYHLISGGRDVTIGVADFVVPYTGQPIKNSDVRTQTARVDSYTSGYNPTSAAVPSLVEDYGATIENPAGTTIQNPGFYDKAVEVFVVGGEGIQGLSRVVYASLSVSKIDISEANKDIAVTSDSPKTYTGETVVFNYTFTGLTQGLDLPADQYTVTYTDAAGNAVAAKDLIEAGKYTAKIDASDADYYYGTRTLEVEILKAPTTLSLADKTNGAGWTSEAYANGNVTYTVDPSVYPEDSGAVLNVTLTATLAGATQALQPVTGTIASQTDLDTLLRNSFVGEEFDAGYTLVITLSNVESKNYLKATDATLTITVGEHVKAPIYASFSDVEDSNVQTAQDDEKDTTVVVTSKGTGLSKENGVYTFVIKVASATSGVTLNSTEGTLGYTVLGPSAQTNAVYDAAAGTITFTFEELPSAVDFTLQAYANSTRYYDSPVYTIDLSGVVSNDIAIYLVQSGYPIAKYTANQLYDLSGDGKSVTGDVAANEKLYLPQTSAAGGHWVLQVPEGSTATTYYAGGALYLIDAADRVTYTLAETMKLNGKDVTSLYGIVFVATGGSDTPVDPTVEQTVEINAVGYTIGNGDAVINAALTDAGYTGDAVADCQDASVFYVVFTASFDGAVTVTLNGEVLGTLKESWTAGVHAVYWAADYAAGTTYKVTIAQATDSTVSDTVSYVFSGNVTPAPSTETSTEVRAALVVDSDGVYLMMVAKDGKAIPDGEITVTYDYTYQRTVAGRTLTGSASASFTQAYTSTGQAYAYILLDFAGQAAEHYSGITGADAVFSAGASGPTATAAGITFALPARA